MVPTSSQTANKMSFTCPANFIDSFKIGDNINYNLTVLSALYTAYGNADSKTPLIKPIVIINTSIAEVLLYDFIEFRVRKANRTEKLFENILSELNSKKLDKFSHYITQAEKYDFFEMKDTNFYGAMHNLRERRNRIHIQNQPFKAPANEDEVFTEKVKMLSEKIVEKIVNTLHTRYPRRAEYHGFVRDFEFPWDRHFEAP